MALIVGDWGDLTIITSLLLFNALLGFWEEYEASNALDALKNSLALKARVLRTGEWEEVDAQTLVPGDIVRLYLGDVVPADCKLIQGLHQHRPIRAHGGIAAGHQEIGRRRILGFRR
jgi:H+-transporting ATPase